MFATTAVTILVSFAETVANIFSANGIKVYLFDDLRPTPECSFAIRHLKAQAGVNITASHNHVSTMVIRLIGMMVHRYLRHMTRGLSTK